jgi:hypothetical protein
MPKDAETAFALGLIDATRLRGFKVDTAIMDKGYDNGPIHDGCMDRDVCPVTPLRQTRPSSVATITRRRASTASGRSPERTTSARR